MEFYIKPCGMPEELFLIESADSSDTWRVSGDKGTFFSKLFLLGPVNECSAKIVRIGTPEISRYSVLIEGRERVAVLFSGMGRKPVFRLSGVPWKFRGDLNTRTFDIVDVDGTVLMTHGGCWGRKGNCFAVTVTREKDVAACLSIAVIIDLFVMSGAAAVGLVSN